MFALACASSREIGFPRGKRFRESSWGLMGQGYGVGKSVSRGEGDSGKAIPEGFPPGKSVSRGESDFGESDSGKVVGDLWVRARG